MRVCACEVRSGFMRVWTATPNDAAAACACSPRARPQAFFSQEQLAGSDSYKCEGCKQCCSHTKRMQLWRPPPVLLLSLKRFSQKGSGGSALFSRFRCA